MERRVYVGLEDRGGGRSVANIGIFILEVYCEGDGDVSLSLAWTSIPLFTKRPIVVKKGVSEESVNLLRANYISKP